MEKTKISALILDYGGVISQPQHPENVSNIRQILNQSFDDFETVYKNRRAPYDSGHISGEAYWLSVLQHYGLTPKEAEIARLIQEDVKSWTHLNESMIQFLTEGRPKIYRLAIVSNMMADTLVFLREQCRWLELFDELVFSCEVGKNKPGREIYETCLTRLKLPPHECLFVDDTMENVKGALAVGMQAIRFKTFAQFEADIAEKFCIMPSPATG